MSYQYDLYLEEHKNNVSKGLAWLRKHLPNILDYTIDYEWHLSFAHDSSKHTPEEYEAYDSKGRRHIKSNERKIGGIEK